MNFRKLLKNIALSERIYKMSIASSPYMRYNKKIMTGIWEENSMFNSLAILAAETTNLGGTLMMVVMLVILVVVFYFFGIRPQKKQEKAQNEMRNSLAVGDEITTIGGIIGKIVSIKEETCVIETTHERTKIRILKTAISRVDVKAEDAAD